MRQTRFPNRALAVALGLAFSVVLAAPAALAQLCPITDLARNGSFESPSLPANSVQHDTPMQWNWVGPQGFMFHGNVGAPWPVASFGEQFVDIGNTTSYALEQRFTLNERRRVFIRYRCAVPAATPAGQARFAVRVIRPDNSIVVTHQNDPALWPTWDDHFTGFHVLEAGTYRLQFSPMGTLVGGPDILIDDVRIEMWSDPESFITAPIPAVNCRGSTHTLVASAAGEPPLFLSWYFHQFDDPAPTLIVEGANPRLGNAANAQGSALTLSNLQIQRGTAVWPIASNACNVQWVSGSVSLNVCIADHNCSASVTVQDIFDFLSDWFAGSLAADVNAGGGVTVQDIFDFLNAWFFGC